MSWFEALSQALSVLLGVGPGPAAAGLAAGIVLITLAAAALLVGVPAVGAELSGSRRLWRERAARVGVPRHRDPDAPGRTRPRGPTGATPAV